MFRTARWIPVLMPDRLELVQSSKIRSTFAARDACSPSDMGIAIGECHAEDRAWHVMPVFVAAAWMPTADSLSVD